MLKFNNKKVSVVGDAMIDFYIYCTPKKISAEAPILILNKEGVNTFLGGAANVALNLKTLGCEVNLYSLTGNDVESSLIHNECFRQGIKAFFMIDNSMTTPIKTRIIAEKQQVVRFDQEKISKYGITSLSKIPSKQELFESDAIILSDYDKGTLKSRSLIQEIIAMAAVKHIPVFIDPTRHDWGKYKGAFCMTPNLSEFEEVSGSKINGKISDIENIAQMLIQRYSLESMIITLGQQGACLIRKNKKTIHRDAFVQEVFDVCGAGDTFIAALSASYTEKKDLIAALEIANIAAGLVVKKHGTATTNKEEIEKELNKIC